MTGISESPAPSPPPSDELHRVHLIGICGSGMRALAELLVEAGAAVSGSDLGPSPDDWLWLNSLGIAAWGGSHPDRIGADVSLCVHSPAVPADDPERRAAAHLRVADLSYPQMVARLMAGRKAVCIAGTHGKSTTTAIVAWILRTAGLNPSAVIGARVLEWNRSGWHGTGGLFVAESCEYERHFLEFTPEIAAVLAVEPDHFDSFPQFAENQQAFRDFAARLPPSGNLIVPAGDACGIDWNRATRAAVVRFDCDSPADWWCRRLRPQGTGWTFDLMRGSAVWGTATIRLPGRHNVMNAVAAAAAAAAAGADADAIVEGLATFPGLYRRFERLGVRDGVDFVDDYAHHPTAVAATLACAREQFPGRRVVCIFQPHQISRTLALGSAFAQALRSADVAFVVPVYAVRETAASLDQPAELSRRIADEVVGLGGDGRFAPSLDHLRRNLDDSLRTGDLLLTMGAGDIGRFQNAFFRRLS